MTSHEALLEIVPPLVGKALQIDPKTNTLSVVGWHVIAAQLAPLLGYQPSVYDQGIELSDGRLTIVREDDDRLQFVFAVIQ
jgi:hypothetical protein